MPDTPTFLPIKLLSKSKKPPSGLVRCLRCCSTLSSSTFLAAMLKSLTGRTNGIGGEKAHSVLKSLQLTFHPHPKTHQRVRYAAGRCRKRCCYYSDHQCVCSVFAIPPATFQVIVCLNDGRLLNRSEHNHRLYHLCR